MSQPLLILNLHPHPWESCQGNRRISHLKHSEKAPSSSFINQSVSRLPSSSIIPSVTLSRKDRDDRDRRCFLNSRAVSATLVGTGKRGASSDEDSMMVCMVQSIYYHHHHRNHHSHLYHINRHILSHIYTQQRHPHLYYRYWHQYHIHLSKHHRVQYNRLN